MANFQKFILTPEEKKEHQRKKAKNFFEEIKRIIEENEWRYCPGEKVAEISKVRNPGKEDTFITKISNGEDNPEWKEFKSGVLAKKQNLRILEQIMGEEGLEVRRIYDTGEAVIFVSAQKN